MGAYKDMKHDMALVQEDYPYEYSSRLENLKMYFWFYCPLTKKWLWNCTSRLQQWRHPLPPHPSLDELLSRVSTFSEKKRDIP